MEKESFKYLYSFKYNNKDYIYLISKKYPFYFLEYNPIKKTFDYPDIDSFKELYKRFYSNEHILSYDIKQSLKLIKEKLSTTNININPLVKTTSGLLSLLIVLSMCGCKQTNASNNINTTQSTITVEESDKLKEIYDYFKSHDMDVIIREYDDNGYIFVREFINSDSKHQITLNSYEEFRNFKNIDFIPTWDDVVEAFQNNKDIDDDKKNIILDCINNIRNSDELKDMDLSVLYANAQRMKFQYLSSEEMNNSVNRKKAYAYFDTVTGIICLPKDRPLRKFEFVHEVLGHGALAYREETEDTVTVFDCTNFLMIPADDRYNGYSVGIMISEGAANMLAHLATNDYSVDSFYALYEEEIRVISNLCNVSIGELFNHKGISLYDLMYENGINTPVEYIFKMDGIYKGKLYCEYSDLMERLFVDATEEKVINSTEEEQNEVIRDTVEIIRNSYFKDQKEFNFEYNGGSINYNFEESANKYQENMDQLTGKTK